MLHHLIALVLLIPLCAGFILAMLGRGVVELVQSKHPMPVGPLLILLVATAGLNGITAFMVISGLKSAVGSQILGLGRNTWLFLVLLAFIGGICSGGYVVFTD
jgi:hypothetical protein